MASARSPMIKHLTFIVERLDLTEVVPYFISKGYLSIIEASKFQPFSKFSYDNNVEFIMLLDRKGLNENILIDALEFSNQKNIAEEIRRSTADNSDVHGETRLDEQVFSNVSGERPVDNPAQAPATTRISRSVRINQNQNSLKSIILELENYTELSEIRYLKLPNQEEKLGEGANGEVFLYTLEDGSERAGKKPRISLFNQSKSDLKQRLKFVLSEVRMLQQLNDHERIIKLFGCYWDDNQIIILMELLSGSVRDKLDNAELSEKEALHYFVQASEGLAYLHSRKPKAVIHRDVKCANLLLDADNNVKLADFGWATDLTINSKSMSVSLVGPTQFVGTYFYCAPEILGTMDDPKSYGRKTDVWSLACTLVEMLSGKPPHSPMSQFDFLQRSSASSTNQLTYSGQLVTNRSKEIQLLLDCMFVRVPKHRPKTVDLFRVSQNMESGSFTDLHLLYESISAVNSPSGHH